MEYHQDFLLITLSKHELVVVVWQRDPAIERFGWIRENPDKYFKWKPRSVRNAVVFCLVIPGALFLFAKTMEVSVSLVIQNVARFPHSPYTLTLSSLSVTL